MKYNANSQTSHDVISTISSTAFLKLLIAIARGTLKYCFSTVVNNSRELIDRLYTYSSMFYIPAEYFKLSTGSHELTNVEKKVVGTRYLYW